MSLYYKVVKNIALSNPLQLKSLPGKILVESAKTMVSENAIFAFEQLNKAIESSTAITSYDNQTILLQHALSTLSTDDFLFLNKYISPEKSSQVDLTAANNQLASRGMVNGLEQIISSTSMQPNLSREHVMQGFDVLVSQARLEAADYLSKLSGMPLTFSDEALQLGYKNALFQLNIAGLTKLHELSSTPLAFSATDVYNAYQKLERLGNYKDLLRLSPLMNIAPTLDAQAAQSRYAELVSNKRLDDLYGLIALDNTSSLLGNEAHTSALNLLVLSAHHKGTSHPYYNTSYISLMESLSQPAYTIAIQNADLKLANKIHSINPKVSLFSNYKKMESRFHLHNDSKTILEHVLTLEKPVYSRYLIEGWMHGVPVEEVKDARSLSKIDKFIEAVTEKTGVLYSRPIGEFVYHLMKGNLEGANQVYTSDKTNQGLIHSNVPGSLEFAASQGWK